MWITGVVLLGLAGALITGLPTQQASPQPVYAPSHAVADPGVLRAGKAFYVFSTGGLGRVGRGDTASGPWDDVGAALVGLPDWAVEGEAIWAPDAWKTSAGYVLYFSAVAKDFDGQRCIGVATSKKLPSGDGKTLFTPVEGAPLVCPGGRRGEDTVPGRPVASAGVIDPSPFRDRDGTRYLLYKTQQTPSSLRMVKLNAKGLHTAGQASRELLQRDGIIENPSMVQRGSHYILLASRYGYENCSYATVWLRSTSRWKFASAAEHSLLTTAGSGICGPGGADVARSLDGGWRIFLHGWICGSGTSACTNAQLANGVTHRRALYAAILTWAANGTPSVRRFL